MSRWIAHFVYQAKDGTAHARTVNVEAPDHDTAYAAAAAKAPGDEFLLTVTAQSDDQYLGQVRSKAAILSGGAEEFDPGTYEDDDPVIDDMGALLDLLGGKKPEK